MSSLKYELSIIDLPSEVIENIGHWLTIKSLNNVMTVNKYIHCVFNNSTIWKKYLYYPERYYKSDIKSHSSCPLVSAVVAEILAGRVGKWRGYFMLQQVRTNTSAISFKLFENISIKPTDRRPLNQIQKHRMFDMVDENGEHWLIIHYWGVNKNFRILNITRSTAQDLGPVCLEFPDCPCEVLELLPQGKILIREFVPKHIICVYQFESPDYIMKLEYKFIYDMDAVLNPSIQFPESEGEDNMFSYTTVENLFISCKREGAMPEMQQLTLHIWNIKFGVKKEKISLGQSTAVVEFLKSVNQPSILSTEKQSERYTILLHPGTTVNTLVMIFQYKGSKQVNIFDLNKKLFTQVDYSELNVPDYYPCQVYCHVFGDKLCLQADYLQSDQPWWLVKSFLTVYSTKQAKCESHVPTPHPLKILTSAKGEYSSRKFGDFELLCNQGNIVMFKQSKVLVQEYNTVTIIILDTMQETKIVIFSDDPDPYEAIAKGCLMLGFIEPKYLLVYQSKPGWECLNRCGRVWAGHIKAIDVERNSVVHTWQDCCLSDGAITYYKKLVYPSRIAIQLQHNLRLFIK